jgi:hypothetical protein
MYKVLAFFVFIFCIENIHAQNSDSGSDSTKTIYVYPFIIQDSPARLFTMRQFNENYMSGYRLLVHTLDKNFSPCVNYAIQSFSNFFVFVLLTHEEGHRSVLVSKNIGSVSQPYFFSDRRGFIDGVTDSTLKYMRDNDFPDYARLHIAGLESDYMLTHREESLISFGQESFKNLAVEYYIRKVMIIRYYLMGLFKHDIDGDEESDELKRDVVGNDVYGVIRHLHRPGMTFHRYTRYNDLTSDEKTYLKNVGYKSLLNLINPNILGLENFKIGDNLKFNFGLGYTLSPFGDFIDQNFWISNKNRLNLQFYVREFKNQSNWFMAGGAGVKDFRLFPHWVTSVDLHFWDQPETLSFNDVNGKLGGAVEAVGRYVFYAKQGSYLKGVSFDLGAICKTSGFLPEEVYLDKHFGVRFGLSFIFDNY